MYPFNVRNFN